MRKCVGGTGQGCSKNVLQLALTSGRLLSAATGTVLAGFTGTPILNKAMEGRQLLDIIKGVRAPRGDGGFLSSFPMRPVSRHIWAMLVKDGERKVTQWITVVQLHINESMNINEPFLNRAFILFLSCVKLSPRPGYFRHFTAVCFPLAPKTNRFFLLRTSLPRGVPDALLTPNLRRQFVQKAPCSPGDSQWNHCWMVQVSRSKTISNEN